MTQVWGALSVLLGFALMGCSPAGPQEPAGVQVPTRVLYFEAMQLQDQALYTDASARLDTLVAENPGTRLGTFAHLKLGEIYSAQGKWPEADTAYRQFLALNSSSDFTPYVLYRLMVANYEMGFTGLLFPSREVDRDMEPNRQLDLEFKRFFLLYPNSTYLEEVRPFYRSARDFLAEYELMVGDFYYDREHYNAAIGRFRYLLQHYPEYPDTQQVVRRLIDAYRANRQPDLADEMERIYQLRFENAGLETSAPTLTAGDETLAEP